MGDPTEPTSTRCMTCGHRGSRATWEQNVDKLSCPSCHSVDGVYIERCGHCGRDGRAEAGRCSWCAGRYSQVLLGSDGEPVAFEVSDAPGFWPYCHRCGSDMRRPPPERLVPDCESCRDLDQHGQLTTVMDEPCMLGPEPAWTEPEPGDAYWDNLEWLAFCRRRRWTADR